MSDDGFCVQFDKCNIKSSLQRLNDSVHLLSRITIAEMNHQQQMDSLPEF
jgi:hypothetical protein